MMKTTVITIVTTLMLSTSVLAQSFLQLSSAERSSLIFYNHNSESYAHQKMIKDKLAQVGISNDTVQGGSSFSQLSESEKHDTVINTLDNSTAYVQQNR